MRRCGGYWWLRFQFDLRVRRRLWSSFEEVLSQGGFEIGNEFTNDLGLGYAESSGRGVAYGFKFSLRDRRFSMMGNSRGKETLAQGRFKVGNKFLENAWSRSRRS